MKEKHITAANADEKVKQLYETAFPEREFDVSLTQ